MAAIAASPELLSKTIISPPIEFISFWRAVKAAVMNSAELRVMTIAETEIAELLLATI